MESESSKGYVFSERDVEKTRVSLEEIRERGSDCTALIAALNQKIKSSNISTAKVSFYYLDKLETTTKNY